MAEHNNNWVGRADLIKETTLKPGTVDNALRALKNKDIILQDDARQGQYRLPTQSFAVWIKSKNRAEKAKDHDDPNLFELGDQVNAPERYRLLQTATNRY